jgi:hypothetical protein
VRPTLHLPLHEFSRSIKNNRLFADLEHAFPRITGRKVSPNERPSWAGSLPRLSGVLELGELAASVEVAVEIVIPYYYKRRVDAALYGHNKDGDPCVLLVELKQWSKVTSDEDGELYVGIGGRLEQMGHPCLQVFGYERYLATFMRAFHTEPRVKLVSCAYLHNYPHRSGPLFDPQYAQAIERAPLFCAPDAESFARFIEDNVGAGGGAEVLQRIWREGCGPSMILKEHASELIYSQNVFTLLDEQISAQRSIISAVKRARNAKRKSIILIEGGPGTGKSLIALDALGQMHHSNQKIFLVSGSSAFTTGMRALLGPKLVDLVQFTDYFWQHKENSVNVLIVDEGHRIRAKSLPRVSADLRPKIPQLDELVHAARVTVLFMDANQIIDPSEEGYPQKVKELAEREDIHFTSYELRAQFRCNGSDEYLQWCDRLFELGDTDGPLLLSTPTAFDFQVLDSPHGLLAWVREKNAAARDSARFVAGWCWPWSDPEEDGTLVSDIRIDDFAFPWELKNDQRGKQGIPEARYWAIDPAGTEQAGTVYSIQGFEFPHIAVLMGPDLVIRNGTWVATPRANFRGSLRRESPEVASIYFRRIYRTLFTRALVSVRLYSVDEETREFIRSKLSR